MLRTLLVIVCVFSGLNIAYSQNSPTEGAINTTFIPENEMMQDILEMVAKNMTYAKSIYTVPSSNNSQGDAMGYFKGNSAGQSNEDGVRTSADYAFICAFLYKYGQPAGVTLPSGITWTNVKEWAIRALTWGYSTHCSLDLARCTDGRTWGSASVSVGSGQPRTTWESSMWTESLAFAYWMLKDELNARQRAGCEKMITEEANNQLLRSIPYGYLDDTKSEENGWDTNILACAVALYPTHPKADAWYLKMQQFAMNTYSVNQDKYDTRIVDGKAVKDWYIGTNLFDDYTLQNHSFFHTSYQNIAIQELSESLMAFTMLQSGSQYRAPDALKHNVEPMWNNVLKYLAMADGELAMPNGNDWSMYLYDQLASYSAMACIYRDPDALMLENMAFKYTKARQTTTTNGAWMLNSDIGGRRMGVTGRRVVMTYLYHKHFSTADLSPTAWDDFSSRHETTRYYPYVNVIRSNTKDRLTVFSWASSKKSYTGMLGTSSPDKNKIFVPYRKGNMGNFTGFFEVNSKATTATPTVSGNYAMYPNAYAMNGELSMCAASVDQRFMLYSTSGNAVIYLYNLYGMTSGTLKTEGGGLMGVSTDPFTKQNRTLYYKGGSYSGNGSTARDFTSPYVNIDNQVGITTAGVENNTMSFRSRSLVNSIYTTELYPIYRGATGSTGLNESFTTNKLIGSRAVVYYSNVSAAQTADLQSKLLTPKVPAGWNCAIVPDPDGAYYLALANFKSLYNTTLNNIMLPEGAPVFKQETVIAPYGSCTTFKCEQNYSISDELRVFVKPAGTLYAMQESGNSTAAFIHNRNGKDVETKVTIVGRNGVFGKMVAIPDGHTVRVSLQGEEIVAEIVGVNFPNDVFSNIATGTHAYANSQLPANMPFLTLDGDPSTYWQSLLNPADGREHITYRLRNAYEISDIRIKAANVATAPLTIEVQTSNTDGNFITRYTAQLSATTEWQSTRNDQPQPLVPTPFVTAKFVRLKITAAAGEQVAISEVQIIGKPSTPAPVPSDIDNAVADAQGKPNVEYHQGVISISNAEDYASVSVYDTTGQLYSRHSPVPTTISMGTQTSAPLLLYFAGKQSDTPHYTAKLFAGHS